MTTFCSQRRLLKEIKIQLSLGNHRGVVKMHRFFEDELNVYMLLELCRRKSIEQVIGRRQRLHEIEVKYYTK